MDSLTVAAVNWKLRAIETEADFFEHFEGLARHAVEQGAQWVVFPEYIGFERLHLAPELTLEDVPRYLADGYEPIRDFGRALARKLRVTIVGGSHPVRDARDRYFNRCPIFLPTGEVVEQDKVNSTTFEHSMFRLTSGRGLRRLPDPRLGVLLCYDAEFPEAGRALAEAGVRVLMVPAFTETRRGFQRVRWSCLARAVENQIFVVHASLVGDLGREPVPETFGSSAVLAPSIEPFPETAVLAETPPYEEAVAVAELDFEALDQCRREGYVRNWDDRHHGDWTLDRPRAAL